MNRLSKQGPVVKRSVLQFCMDWPSGGCTLNFEAPVAWIQISRTTVKVLHRGRLVTELGDYEDTAGLLTSLDQGLRVAIMAADAMGADRTSDLVIEAHLQVFNRPAVDEDGGPLKPVPDDWLIAQADGFPAGDSMEPKGVTTVIWSSSRSDEANEAMRADVISRWVKRDQLPDLGMHLAAQMPALALETL